MTRQLADSVFWRIARIPFDAYMAALESWQLTGHNGELRLGDSLLRGPIEHDQHFSAYRNAPSPAQFGKRFLQACVARECLTPFAEVA